MEGIERNYKEITNKKALKVSYLSWTMLDEDNYYQDGNDDDDDV